jgi:uncharacterized protein (DUF305 family)
MKNLLRTAAAVLTVAAMAGGGAAGASAATVSKTDEAFARQMAMHHSKAIELAKVAIEAGEHKAIRTTARNIVKSQKREIDRLMKIATRLDIPPSATHGHTQMMEDLDTLGVTMKQAGMKMEMGPLTDADPFDRKFIDMMVPHHQGAVLMANAELRHGKVDRLRQIARSIVEDQGKEIHQMNEWRTAWYGSPSPAGGVPRR